MKLPAVGRSSQGAVNSIRAWLQRQADAAKLQEPSMRRIILVAATLIASWLGMQAVHEVGHVLGARLSGGTVTRVALYPLTLSHTDLGLNPSPLFVVWMGPLVGVIVPVLLWVFGIVLRVPERHLARFFAGFCLVANGVYIGTGPLVSVGDGATMLHYGSAPWHLVLFALATVPIGFRLWHGEGRHFGLGAGHGTVSSRSACVSVLACVLLVALGCIVGGR